MKRSVARIVADRDGMVFPAVDSRWSNVDFPANEPRVGIVVSDFEGRDLPPANDRRPRIFGEQERTSEYDQDPSEIRVRRYPVLCDVLKLSEAVQPLRERGRLQVHQCQNSRYRAQDPLAEGPYQSCKKNERDRDRLQCTHCSESPAGPPPGGSSRIPDQIRNPNASTTIRPMLANSITTSLRSRETSGLCTPMVHL